jgi:hypothetical protein
MSQEQVSRPVRGMAAALTNLVMDFYKADDVVVEDVQAWVERYLPEPKLKLLTQRLKILWYRQADLMSRLTNQDLRDSVSHPVDRAGRRIRNLYLNKLEDNMRVYANLTWGKKFFHTFMHRSDVRQCEYSLEKGFLLWIDLRSEAYLTLAALLIAILERAEQIFGQSLPSRLGEFAAYRAARYVSGVLEGDVGKWIEERTALMYVIAYGLSRPAGLSKTIEPIIRAAVRVAGLRFATSFQPELGPLEEEAVKEWFSLHVPENIPKLFAWIDAASKEGVPRKVPLFELHLGYAKGLAAGEFYGKRFPTPFFYVPKQFWKQSIMEDEFFPSDILSGQIPLVAVPPKGLFLVGRQKRIPIVGIWSVYGGGKSVLQYATACWRIDRGYIVFQPTMPRDQALIVCLPMFSTETDLENLKKQRIKPRGMPAMFLTIYENDEDVRQAAPYTIYDRKICVDKLDDFKLNWQKLLGTKENGFKRGYLSVRDLSSKERTSSLRSSLITDFFNYRRIDRSRDICLQIDEIQDVYGAIFQSSQEASLVRTVQSAVNDIRGLNLPTELASSRPSLLQPDVLEWVTSFIFGDVRESGREKVRSSRAVMFEAIRKRLGDEEKKFMPLVEKVMENVPLDKLKLFFMIDHMQRIRLIRAALPPHMLEDPNIDPGRQLAKYEELFNKKVLVSWNEVPELDVALAAAGQRKGENIEYR